jgi:hypothetical protein
MTSRALPLARSLPLALLLLLTVACSTPTDSGPASEGASTASVDVTGTWQLQVTTSQGSGAPTLKLKQSGDKVSGSYEGQFGKARLRGTVTGDELTLKFRAAGPVGEVPVTYVGKVNGDSMEGTVKAGPGEGTFTGKRQ